jgi:Tat protein secretion system quality control protein TatD with DNase activity
LKHQLPPKLYFHAFGGKVGTIPQLLASCSSKTTQVYFGLAAVINFRSPKTADVIRAIGLDRLVLETDQEDAALVYESMQRGIQYLAQALDVTEEEVIAKTTRNAMDFYGIIV